MFDGLKFKRSLFTAAATAEERDAQPAVKGFSPRPVSTGRTITLLAKSKPIQIMKAKLFLHLACLAGILFAAAAKAQTTNLPPPSRLQISRNGQNFILDILPWPLGDLRPTMTLSRSATVS